MALRIDNLSFSYDAINVIDNISLSLQKGSTTALIGSSGTGKTTLLRLIMGLLTPQAGSMHCEGSISYLMQKDTLLPWRTVWDHLTLIFELEKRKHHPDILYRLIDLIGLKGAENKYPHELSGGMKRRVSLAQAVLKEHALLLLDEPFSSLDIHTRERLFDLLNIIQEDRGSTILLVTHDYRDAVSVSNQIMWLSKGSIAKKWQVPSNIGIDPEEEGKFIHEIRQTTSV